MELLFCKKGVPTTHRFTIHPESAGQVIGVIIWSNDSKAERDRGFAKLMSGVGEKPVVAEIKTTLFEEGPHSFFFWASRVGPREYLGSIEVEVRFEKTWRQDFRNWLQTFRTFRPSWF